MKTIWKYNLDPLRSIYPMPDGAELLSVHEQHGVAQLWALVDPSRSLVNRFIPIYPT